MKKPGKKSVVPALVLAGGLAYQTLADKVKDTYNQIMPETAQHEVAHKDYAGEFLENILEQNKLYAGGLSEEEKKERREANLPKELQGDIFDYFDGEIYKGDSPDFPDDRWNFGSDLSRKTGDLKHVFDPDNKLYSMIGKYLEPTYENNTLVGVFYNESNTEEIGLSFKINDEFYIGFKKIEPGMIKALKKHNDDIVY